MNFRDPKRSPVNFSKTYKVHLIKKPNIIKNWQPAMVADSWSWHGARKCIANEWKDASSPNPPNGKAQSDLKLRFPFKNCLYCKTKTYPVIYTIWHYRLWSFKFRDTKLERFLPKNQQTQRKLLNFENWTNGEPQ